MDTTTPALASIGIDIGKDVFHLVGFGADGKIALRRKIKRLALADTFKALPPCIVGMKRTSARTLSVVFCVSSVTSRGSSLRFM